MANSWHKLIPITNLISSHSGKTKTILTDINPEGNNDKMWTFRNRTQTYKIATLTYRIRLLCFKYTRQISLIVITKTKFNIQHNQMFKSSRYEKKTYTHQLNIWLQTLTTSSEFNVNPTFCNTQYASLLIDNNNESTGKIRQEKNLLCMTLIHQSKQCYGTESTSQRSKFLHRISR